MKKNEIKDPIEELFYGCLGPVILVGMAIGASIVGLIWALVELFQWLF